MRITEGFYGKEYEEKALNTLPPRLRKRARSVSGISWISKDFSFQLGLVSMGYGNEPCLDESPVYAAVLTINDTTQGPLHVQLLLANLAREIAAFAVSWWFCLQLISVSV